MKKLLPSLIEIVETLNDGQYHDGNTIGRKLNISRAGVWKTIKKLEKYGIQLHSIKGKGYALHTPLILLDEVYIKQNIENKNIDITVFETIDSTNNYLKNFIGTQQIKIAISEHQTNGRGRLGRSWHSPFGCNLYFSCLYPFRKDISCLSGLSIVVGLAIVQALKTFNLSEPIYLKWPNDIIYQGRKLAGILIETQAEANGISYAVIGIGINVNMKNQEQAITQPWTSLKEILNQPVNRNLLCILLINNLLLYLDKMRQEGFMPFLKEWEKVDGLRDKKITINNYDTITIGISKGIDNNGNLLLELDDHSIQAFSSGEASLCKTS